MIKIEVNTANEEAIPTLAARCVPFLLPTSLLPSVITLEISRQALCESVERECLQIIRANCRLSPIPPHPNGCFD